MRGRRTTHWIPILPFPGIPPNSAIAGTGMSHSRGAYAPGDNRKWLVHINLILLILMANIT